MAITTDVILKGSNWKKALTTFNRFFSQSSQPNYSIFVISISIGIMYDKQLDIAGEETPEEKENRATVPRTVLHLHESDLDFLFQTAILNTSLVELNEEERMDLAFNTSANVQASIQCSKLEFLNKFANFGVGKFLEKGSDEPIEAMENIKLFLAATMEGHNYEIDAISEEDLNEEDLYNT